MSSMTFGLSHCLIRDSPSELNWQKISLCVHQFFSIKNWNYYMMNYSQRPASFILKNKSYTAANPKVPPFA